MARAKTELSAREEQIIELAIEGHTNEGIANELGVSTATINTYWLRIRMKVNGSARADTVAKVLMRRMATQTLRDGAELDGKGDGIGSSTVKKRATLALLQVAMEKIKAIAWATNLDLKVEVFSDGNGHSSPYGSKWETGKTVYEMFGTRESKHPAIAAHLAALDGEDNSVVLDGVFAEMTLRVIPIYGESKEIMGCIGLLQPHVEE